MGGEGKRAVAPGAGRTSLDVLPDGVIGHVLSFLPALQAVQTCVLARRWLNLWKSVTGLRIVGADGKEPVPFEEVWEFVDSLLLLRGSSPLETFEAKVTGAAVDDRHLRLWVRYSMMCNVQVLRLKVYGNAPTSLRSENLPLASRYLTNIELRGVVFNNDFLDFSRCPALQDLKIKYGNFIHVEKISSQSLKQIQITRGIFNLNSRIQIHTPNLVSLELQITGGRAPLLHTMPLLVLADIIILGNSDCCGRSSNGDCGVVGCQGCLHKEYSSVLLHAISQVETLDLEAYPEMFIFRRDLKWCPTFSKLKKLTLTEHLVHALECILEHSPVLESLKLYLLVLDKEGFKVQVKMNGRFNPTYRPLYHHSLRQLKSDVEQWTNKFLKFWSS